MIIKCINKKGFDNLTLDKEYVVIDERQEYYVVISDNNEEVICRLDEDEYDLVYNKFVLKNSKEG